MKDNDFKQYVKQIEFVDHFQNSRSLLEKLYVDANFLSQNNLIDYSLIIGEIEIESLDALREAVKDNEEQSISSSNIYISDAGKAYILGIIDPLTNFK